MTRHPLDELDDDLRDHLARETQSHIERGLSPTQARAAARRRLGSLADIRDQTRAVWIPVWLDQCRQDIRYAARTLVRSRVYTGTATATLALGIAASTVMFGVLQAVVLQPLPYPESERLVKVWTGAPEETARRRAAWRTVEAWQHAESLESLLAYDTGTATLEGQTGSQRITVMRTTPSLFPVLGMKVLRGRAFSESDAREGSAVAVISHEVWLDQFGGSGNAIGATVVVDGRTVQIIGVLPANLDIVGIEDQVDVILPYTAVPNWTVLKAAAGAGPWSVVGKLKPGATISAAQAEIAGITMALDASVPAGFRAGGAAVGSMHHSVVGERVRLTLWLLTGAGLCVLLIAVANITSLSLARSLDRAREMALRASIGATRWRIARQLLVESLVLAAIAGVIGTAVAAAALRLVRTYGPSTLVRLDQIRLDPVVLAWAVGLTVCAGVLVGFAPVATLWRHNLHATSQEGGRSVSSSARSRAVRRALVVAELALAVALLGCAGLLVRSWSSLIRVDAGFDTHGILSVQLSATMFESPEQRAAFYTEVLTQVGAVPGVETVGMMSDLFVSSTAERVFTADTASGVQVRRLRVRLDEASEQAFETVGTPILRGRAFDASDRADAPRVAIINRPMARALWGTEDPIGKRVSLGPPEAPGPSYTVVGVIGDMRRQGLEHEPVAQMFEAVGQNPPRLSTLLVRSSGAEPLVLARGVQDAIRRVNARVPIYGVTSLDARFARDLAQRRFQTAVLLGLSVVALAMAAIGIYGLMLHSVLSRTQEFGIRLALGAPAADIFRLTMREGLQLTLAGLAVGLVVAMCLAQAIRGLLFGITDRDPLTLGVVVAVLAVVAVISCYGPARRAMRIDAKELLHQV